MDDVDFGQNVDLVGRTVVAGNSYTFIPSGGNHPVHFHRLSFHSWDTNFGDDVVVEGDSP